MKYVALPDPRIRGYVVAVSATFQDFCSPPAVDRSGGGGLVARTATEEKRLGGISALSRAAAMSVDGRPIHDARCQSCRQYRRYGGGARPR